MPPSLVRPSIQILRLELRHVGTSPVGAYRRTRTACSASPRTSGSGFATPIPAIAPAAARTPRRARAVASRTSARRQRSRQRALRVIKGGSHLRAPNYRLRSGEISAKRAGLHDHVHSAMATCSTLGAGVRLDETVDLHWPVTLVCSDNGSGRALADSGLAVHRMSSASRAMRHSSIRRCYAPCHRPQRKESASAPRKYQRSR